MKAASNREPDGGVIWFPPALAVGRSVPWWGLISAAAAFVALVGGCAVAAALQPSSFNWLASTVSTLTEPGAADRWVTIAAFAVTGACGIATAVALRPAALAGRLILAVAGAAAVVVAANPEHAGGALTHGLWAAAAFTALIAWTVGAWRRGASVLWGPRPAVSGAGVGALLAWYLAELIARGGMTGLAERAMCAALVGWPLTVVLSCRRLEQPDSNSDYGPKSRPTRMTLGRPDPVGSGTALPWLPSAVVPGGHNQAVAHSHHADPRQRRFLAAEVAAKRLLADHDFRIGRLVYDNVLDAQVGVERSGTREMLSYLVAPYDPGLRSGRQRMNDHDILGEELRQLIPLLAGHTIDQLLEDFTRRAHIFLLN